MSSAATLASPALTAAPTRAPPTAPGKSCAGAKTAPTQPPRPSTGNSSPSLATNAAAPPTPATPDAAADRFACPDGLHFDSGGLLWIQTDMGPRAMHRGEFEHLGNNALLCANVETGDIRRFLTGPRGAEITGCVLTPDCTTLFVNIQHPGEADDAGATQPVSAWPDGQTPGSALPRSATVVVRREDGGRVGT